MAARRESRGSPVRMEMMGRPESMYFTMSSRSRHGQREQAREEDDEVSGWRDVPGRECDAT
jgi:hypothetical protein